LTKLVGAIGWIENRLVYWLVQLCMKCIMVKLDWGNWSLRLLFL